MFSQQCIFLLSLQEEKVSTGSTSDELATGFSHMKIADESFLSPETASTASLTGDGNGSSTARTQPRELFNTFLNQCNIQPLRRPWLEWGEVSSRTRPRYIQRSSEIVSTVLKTISPINAPHLWEALQSCDVVNRQLGLHAVSLPSEVGYLEALAESYSNAASWTRRQVLSVRTGVASFKAISTFIPGLTQYQYTMAKLHGVQHGRNVPVPEKKAPRLQIEPKQFDHFLGFITSPHLVQGLPFGEKHLHLSSGKVITVPNIVRTMIPERIVTQYNQYCAEANFKPSSRSTLLQILSDCSASVRTSPQGLDYFVAEGGRAFDDLASIADNVSLLRTNGEEWGGRIKDQLKAGKLYLKSDFKVSINDSNHIVFTFRI